MIKRLYNVDELRHGVVRMDPARDLTTSYYEQKLAAPVTRDAMLEATPVQTPAAAR